jgi:nicotinate-nucleotide adenylyltransferase
LNSIETVYSGLKLDEFWIVPAYQNPLREPLSGPTAPQRLEMVKRALAAIQNDRPILARGDEVARGGASYTVETLTQFVRERKEAEFYLIIGADQLPHFDKWKDFQKILKLANLVVTSRPGTELPQSKADMPEWLQKQLKAYRSDRGILKSGKELRFIKLQDVDVSGTEVRRKVRREENVLNLIPSQVFDYIKEQKLYDKSEILISDYSEFTRFCAKIAVDKGGLAALAYDLREVVQPSEYALVLSGTSTRHTRALSEHIIKEAKDQYGIYPQSTEGLQEGRWIIVDYGALMIHIFYDFVRNEYRLEELWRQAKRLNI